ncbi:MAG TPA: PIN domain-containing protein [Desulfuromonadales bacterium]|nr:PIN domain-containing protein [Desulfuromonadales bacterium]
MATNSYRVFLDSNVIISGMLSDKGAPRIILDLLSLHLPGIIGLTGEYNLIEVERNLTRKLPKALPVYLEYVPRLSLTVIPLPTAEEIAEYVGAINNKDLPVLLSAIKGCADFLVTGDNKDFSLINDSNLYSFTVISPTEFLEKIGKIISATTQSTLID